MSSHPKNRTFPTNGNQGAFALVLVLWILSLLTIMAGSFALTMRRESAIVAGIKDSAGAIAQAEAGIAFAELMLLNPEQDKRWRADGNIYQVDFGETIIRIKMVSESGKIDINKAGLPLLQALFAKSPADEEQQGKLVGAVLDWRDPDDLVNLNGAEKDQYKKEGLKYGPRNKPFQAVEELQMLLGMDELIYNWLAPIITVYSGKPQVNIKLATPKVLNILPGLDAGLIDSFIAARLDSAKNDLPVPEFTGGLSGIANSGGGAVTIISEALMPDETSAIVVATVMKAETGGSLPDETDTAAPFTILKWERSPLNEASLFTDEMTEYLVKQYAEPELSD
jgi:general secretion pathway protein K